MHCFPIFIYGALLATALIFLWTFLHILETWQSNESSLSILTPNNFSQSLHSKFCIKYSANISICSFIFSVRISKFWETYLTSNFKFCISSIETYFKNNNLCFFFSFVDYCANYNAICKYHTLRLFETKYYWLYLQKVNLESLPFLIQCWQFNSVKIFQSNDVCCSFLLSYQNILALLFITQKFVIQNVFFR